MAKGKKSGYLISAAIFFILEFAAFELLRCSDSLQNIWVNRSAYRVRKTLWQGTEKVKTYFSLAEKNDMLAEENFRLSERVRQLSALESPENLDGIENNDHFEYIPAAIVKLSRNSQHNYIILNKGSEDGVRPSSGIITEKGVIGIISVVDKHYSYGLSLMNAKISVSARIGKDGIVVPLKWDGKSKNGAFLTDVPIHSVVNPDDTVYTSGFSDFFPGDIPLGTTGETLNVGGSSMNVTVNLFNDFSSVHYVTICHDPYREEILSLEKNEEDKK